RLAWSSRSRSTGSTARSIAAIRFSSASRRPAEAGPPWSPHPPPPRAASPTPASPTPIRRYALCMPQPYRRPLGAQIAASAIAAAEVDLRHLLRLRRRLEILLRGEAEPSRPDVRRERLLRGVVRTHDVVEAHALDGD